MKDGGNTNQQDSSVDDQGRAGGQATSEIQDTEISQDLGVDRDVDSNSNVGNDE